MTTLNGIMEKLEHAIGLVEGALAWLPGTDPRVVMLRTLVSQMKECIAMSDVRTALAEVESKASAQAQQIADEWPDPSQ